MRNVSKLIVLALVAFVAASCSSAFYSSGSGSAYDDMYVTHDRTSIAQRQQAEAEARRAEAEARRAEAEALKAEYEAEAARLLASTPSGKSATVTVAKSGQRIDADGLVIVEDNTSAPQAGYSGFVANNYESAYARRLAGFKSASYRMPSSYFDLRYGGSYSYVTAYDPAFYNIMVSGDQVWVEPRYITSMFGTWGATNATAVIYSPWYYGWGGWHHYDPWYYSRYGYPRYSWYDWNWNICYGGGWGVNLWWGWGGHYHPYRPAYHFGHHYNHHHYGPSFGGWWGGNKPHALRHNAPRVVGNKPAVNPGHKPGGAQPPRGGSAVNRGSVYSTPYRSPITGSTYGQSSRGNSNAAAAQSGSVGRGSATSGGAATSATTVNRGTSTTSRGSAVSSRPAPSRSTSTSKSSVNSSSSTSRSRSTTLSSSSSSSSSSSRYSSGASYSSGSSSRGGGGYSGSSFSGSSSRGGGGSVGGSGSTSRGGR